jgi:hypothetical protein
MDNKNPDLLISVHIYKTAGSTFHSILDRHIKKEEVVYANFIGIPEVESMLRNNETIDKEKIRLIHGHFPYGWHKYFNRNCKYITFLREPVERIVSDYHYNKCSRFGHNYKFASTMSLQEYVDVPELIDLDNGMTRFVSGDFETPYGQLTNKTLEKAIVNIDNDFIFVGITERFDESIILFAELVKFRKIYYESKNITSKKSNKTDSGILNHIREKNKFDIQLYEYALKKFEKDYQNIPDLKFKTACYKNLHRIYNLVHPVYNSVFK